MNCVPESDDYFCETPELIPPLYYIYPILAEFILLSERGEIPFNSNEDGSFYTFPRKEEVKEVKKIKESKKTTEAEDNFYLKMTLIEFNNYTKYNPISDDYRELLKHKRRKIKNCGYSKVARLKAKAKKLEFKQNIIQNTYELPVPLPLPLPLPLQFVN